MLTMLMSSLGQMIFATALPTIVGDLGGVDQMTWVITAFLLGQTIAMPIMGKLGDQVNRKPLFILANLGFMLGSLIGGLAGNMTTLIAARAIQGTAGGAIMILSQAILAEVTTTRERGKYMGLIGTVFGVASVLGPVLGGWFTDGPGWRWGLWLNLPIGLVAVLVATFFLHLRPKPVSFRLDWLGTLTMAAATTAMVLCVTWGGHDYEWSAPIIKVLIGSALILTVVFVFIELRVKDPLISMQLFRNRNFLLTTLAGLVIGGLMFGAIAYVPTYLQMVHHMTPTKAGVAMITMMGGLVVSSMGVGGLVAKTGRYKIYPLIGQVITSVALFLLSTLDYEDSMWLVGCYLALFGLGLGATVQILVLIVQNSFPLTKVGQATGSNNFFRQVGGAVGAALVGSTFLSNLHDELAENMPQAMLAAAQQGTPPELLKQLTSASRFTPNMVADLPQVLQEAIGVSYNDALTPVFLLVAPLSVIAVLFLCFVREDRLSEQLESNQ